MEKTKQKVSVIIPTYNRAHLIARAIDSVFSQTYDNYEIIVVDDGSTDNTKKLLEDKYADRIKYIYQENHGGGSARNAGFKISTGEYINFLDSDDYFLKTNLEEKVKALDNHPEIGWAYTDQYYEGSGNLIRSPHLRKLTHKLKKANNIFKLMLLGGGLTSTNTVMLRRKCVEEVGGFDETLRAYQDEDFFLRIAYKYNTLYIDQPLSIRTEQPDSMSSDRAKYYRGMEHYIETIARKFPAEVKKYGWHKKCRKWKADIHNFFGQEYLSKGEKKKAREEFIKSIRIYPYQGSVYLNYMKAR